MRKAVTRLALAATAAVGVAAVATPASAIPAGDGTILVLGTDGAADASVRSAIAKAGGTVVAGNADVGVYTVRADAATFGTRARQQKAIAGVAANISMGRAPADHMKQRDVERLSDAQRAQLRQGPRPTPVPQFGVDPLAPLQWDMDMIQAPQAHALGQTGRGVRVGIMDTGVDGSHPDIAPNFNRALSRNFTVDDPIIDGPCEDDPDGSCNDPNDVDEDGHGTHVAGTIASPINGIGIAGVAPDAEIVNLRAGQDAGYFFVQPTVDALTYAADNGIDVVNMSYYIDPWLYNCRANPADSPAAQAQQRLVIDATNRALRYARRKGVTLVSAAGNENTDLDNPTFDGGSPDYPPDMAYDRQVDRSCLTMPTQGDGVLAISSVGPSGLKAYYSNWGTQDITVAAPGGSFRDFYGTPRYRTVDNLILAPMPESVGLANGDIDADTGEPTTPFVVRDCTIGACSYYQYLQGTSMASPHATGVVAEIVGRWGTPEPKTGGLKLNPQQAEKILTRTATDTACPAPVYDYPDLPDPYTSNCDGNARFNGWYGEGIVNTLQAVTRRN